MSKFSVAFSNEAVDAIDSLGARLNLARKDLVINACGIYLEFIPRVHATDKSLGFVIKGGVVTRLIDTSPLPPEEPRKPEQDADIEEKFTVNFGGEAGQELTELGTWLNIPRAQVVREAMRLYSYITEQLMEHHEEYLALVQGDEESIELVIVVPGVR